MMKRDLIDIKLYHPQYSVHTHTNTLLSLPILLCWLWLLSHSTCLSTILYWNVSLYLYSESRPFQIIRLVVNHPCVLRASFMIKENGNSERLAQEFIQNIKGTYTYSLIRRTYVATLAHICALTNIFFPSFDIISS